MQLYVKGRYHNGPAGLHFAGPGVVELDDPKALFLLRDAPENFSTEIPVKAIDEPVVDKMIKAPARKKAV